MSDERGTGVGGGQRARQILCATLLALFLLPWVTWPNAAGEARALNGFDVLATSFRGVGQSYDAAVAAVEARLEEMRQASERARERAEKTAQEAFEARAAADAAPDEQRLQRDADRKERTARLAAEAADKRAAELVAARQETRSFWTHYLLYAFPATLALTLLAALASLALSIAGRADAPAALIAGLGATLAFLGAHIWLGVDLLGSLSLFAWVGWLTGIALIPAALGLLRTAEIIDAVNERIGKGVAWLALFMVLVQFALVIMRYVFGVGSIMVQESLIYAHGLLFMVAAGYTLLVGGHVRVDIFYRESPPRKKAVVDLLGVLLLLIPVSLLIWRYALPYVASSWAVLEGSRETSGIPAVFLLKTAMPVFVILMILQGLSLALRSILVLQGRAEHAGPMTGGGH